MVPQDLFHISVESPAPLGTGQAAFPYIRLFGESFSVPPLYDTGSGLCGAWVEATPQEGSCNHECIGEDYGDPVWHATA